MPMLLTARQAAERLGIKLDTLYAYVSRGRLRSVAVPSSRERHYDSEEIDAFGAGRGGSIAVVEAGRTPPLALIESSICLIEDGRLYYRGRDAIRLSDTATLEDTAALLWEVETPRPVYGGSEGPAPKAWEGEGQLPLIERCQVRLAMLAAADPNALDLSPAGVRRTGWVILAELAALIGTRISPSAPLHRRLAAAWRLDAAGADIVRRCLVLLADHELNASTFAARVVASTGVSPYAVVSAALGALSGNRHGGAASRVEALFRAAAASGDPITAIAERLIRGDELPGIGQPLYPAGDPRAVAILYALSLLVPQARRLVGRQPNVDFALGATSVALRLPQGSALAMFVIARTVGWIAHALEQYQSGELIRPRARYVGPRPATP
jgi:citrate synthase